MGTPPAPAPAGDHLAKAIETLIAAPGSLEADVLPIGSGPLAVAEQAHGALGLDQAGNTVLFVGVPAIVRGTPAAIADELDHIARMDPSALQQSAAVEVGDLAERHSKHFNTGDSVRLNTDQRVVVVTGAEPTEKAWKELVIELGPRLSAVYRLEPDGRVTALEPPPALRRSTSKSGWTGWNWVALAAVLLGVGVLLLGLARLLLFQQDEDAAQALDSPIRSVAADVPSDATHANWIGQRRALITSRGKIVLLFRNGAGLQLVTDESNRGRTWRSPVVVSEISPSSFSAALDARDGIHVALIEEGIPSVVSLRQSPTGWVASEAVRLSDSETTSAVIDLTWDPAADTGYVVWAEPGDDGEELRWASISPGDEQVEVTAEDSLAESTDGIPILANIASGGDSSLIVTYRSEAEGWSSRLASIDKNARGRVTWQTEETVPVEGGVGASALVVDRTGNAHLLLRNDIGPRLEYFRRSPRGGWSSAEEVALANSIEGVDLPALSVDIGSRLIYAFFQTDAGVGSSQVQVAVRDPATGWEGPYEVAPPSVVAEGSGLPASTGIATGEPLVFWTSGGDSPSVQSARVLAP